MAASIAMASLPDSPWATPVFAARSGTWATYVPRLFGSAANLTRLRANWTAGAPYASLVTAFNTTDGFGLALNYLATGTVAKATAAYTAAVAQSYAIYQQEGTVYADYAAYCLDWCWPDLTAPQRATLAAQLESNNAARLITLQIRSQLHEYHYQGFHAYLIGVIAAQGESGATDRAAEMRNVMQHYLYFSNELQGDAAFNDYHYQTGQFALPALIWEMATGQNTQTLSGIKGFSRSLPDWVLTRLSQLGASEKPASWGDEGTGSTDFLVNLQSNEQTGAWLIASIAGYAQDATAKWLANLMYTGDGWSIYPLGIGNEPEWVALLMDDATLSPVSPSSAGKPLNYRFPIKDQVSFRDAWNLGAAGPDIQAIFIGGMRDVQHSQPGAGILEIWRGDDDLLAAGSNYGGTPSNNYNLWQQYSVARNCLDLIPLNSATPDTDGSQKIWPAGQQPAGSATTYPWSNNLMWTQAGGAALQASVLSFQESATEHCVYADCTNAYAPTQTSEYIRGVSWIPAFKLFIVRDLFTGTGAVGLCRQNWHVRAKPTITGEVVVTGGTNAGVLTCNNGIKVVQGSSQAFIQAVSASPDLACRLTGGAGYEQYINGAQVDFATNCQSGYAAPTISALAAKITGQWRIALESSPSGNAGQLITAITIGASGDATPSYTLSQLTALAPLMFSFRAPQGGTVMATPGFRLDAKYQGHPYIPIYVRNNAPINGQYSQAAPPGGLVLDMVAGVLYQNTGTIDASTWAVWGVTIPAGAVAPATMNFAALPTADPHVAGLLWVNSAVVTRSAG